MAKKSKKLPTWATTVTPLSKTIALLMFILLPVVAFYYGTYYQKQIDKVWVQQEVAIYKTQSTPPHSCSPAHPCNPPNGTITCRTTDDCPKNYVCAQPGPIIQGKPIHQSCWERGSAVPL